jgi:hypothetical protein
VDIGVTQTGKFLVITYELTYSGIVEKNKIEKITLSLNPLEYIKPQIIICSSHSNYISRTGFAPQPNRRTKLSFSSFSVRKLNTIHNKCISDEELNNFGEDYFDFIVHDCYFKSLNQSYGCITSAHQPVYFDRYILKNGYKFCKNSNITINSLTKIFAECFKRSKPKCNSINFNSKIETTKLLSNEIILEFIPLKIPRIAYTETFKTDFDRFIYNYGGVLSLWFGLTPIKLVDILKYLPLISKILISKSIKIVHYLKSISIRFAQNLIIVCKIFGLYLFGIGVRFAQNLIAIYKRFCLFLIANIITFAYNLIAIFMRFFRYLFQMNSTEN